jgi:putative membrane protein
MPKVLMRWFIASLALYVAVQIVPGISYEGGWTTLAAMALIFGLVNAFIRPILSVLSCPLIILTMGVFLLVINGAMLLLASRLAFWGALVVSMASFLLNLFFEDEDEDKE